MWRGARGSLFDVEPLLESHCEDEQTMEVINSDRRTGIVPKRGCKRAGGKLFTNNELRK